MTIYPYDSLLTGLANLLIALALAGYVRASLRSRAAVGLWWDFDRDDEPVRFWLWLIFIGVWVISSIGRGIMHLTGFWTFV